MRIKCIEKRLRLFLAGIVCLLGLVFCFAQSSMSQAATGDVMKTGTLTFNETDKREYSFTFDAPRDISIVFEFKSDKDIQHNLVTETICNLTLNGPGIYDNYLYPSNHDRKTFHSECIKLEKGTHTYTLRHWSYTTDYSSVSIQYSIIDATGSVSSIIPVEPINPQTVYASYDYYVNYSTYGNYDKKFYTGKVLGSADLELVTLQSSGAYATLDTSWSYLKTPGLQKQVTINLHFNNINNGGSITVLIRDKITGVQSEPLVISLSPRRSPRQINVLEQEYAYANKNQIKTDDLGSTITSVRIYRSNQENGPYTCIATVTPKKIPTIVKGYYDYKVIYNDKSVKANTRYYYKLACLQSSYSEYSLLSEKAAMFWTAPKQVSGKAKYKFTGKGIWLKWKKVKGAGVRYAVKDTSPQKALGKNIFGQTVYRSESVSYRKTKKCKMRENEWNHFSRKIHSYVKRNGKYYSHGQSVSKYTFTGFGGKKIAY